MYNLNQAKYWYIIVPLLFISLGAMPQKKETAEDRCKKIGPAYIIINTGKKELVLSVMEWEEKKLYHYYLQLTDIQNAIVIKQKEIAVSIDKPIEHEQIIGRMGNIIYILTDSLSGYNDTSLEMTITETIIAEKNPFMKNNFSRRYNSYLLDEAAQVMYTGAEDGERYKLYPSDLLMKPDDTISDPAPEGFIYEFAAEYTINDKYNLKFALTCVDTFQNTLYLLGSEKETGNVLSYFGTSIFPEQEESRKLTIVPYHPDGEKTDYRKNKPVTTAKQYYKAGFLQSKFTTTAWHGSNGEKIIVYYSNKTNEATLCIAGIDKNGGEKWMKDTGRYVTDFSDYLLTDTNLLIWFGGYQKGTNIPKSAFTSIRLTDGISNSYRYQH